MLAAEALASRIVALHLSNPAGTSSTELLAHAPEQLLLGIAAACRGDLQTQLTCDLPEILHASAVRCAIQQRRRNALLDTHSLLLNVPVARAQTGRALVTALASVPEVTRLRLCMDPRELEPTPAPDGQRTPLAESGVLAAFDGLPATAVTVGFLLLCLLLALFPIDTCVLAANNLTFSGAELGPCSRHSSGGVPHTVSGLVTNAMRNAELWLAAHG